MRWVRLPVLPRRKTTGQIALSITAWSLLLTAVTVAAGPASRIDIASGTGIRPEDVGQFWAGFWLLVGWMALMGWMDWRLTTTTCPRCGRQSRGGLVCSECYWRSTDLEQQDEEIEARR